MRERPVIPRHLRIFAPDPVEWNNARRGLKIALLTRLLDPSRGLRDGSLDARFSPRRRRRRGDFVLLISQNLEGKKRRRGN